MIGIWEVYWPNLKVHNIIYIACVMLIMNVREKMSFVIDGFSHKAANIINNEQKWLIENW